MTILEEISDLVIEVPDFADSQLCASIIERALRTGFHAATIQSEDGMTVLPDVRNNSRAIFDDVGLADELWQRIKRDVPSP